MPLSFSLSPRLLLPVGHGCVAASSNFRQTEPIIHPAVGLVADHKVFAHLGRSPSWPVWPWGCQILLAFLGVASQGSNLRSFGGVLLFLLVFWEFYPNENAASVAVG